MKTGFFSLERTVNGQFRFDLVASNNEEILHSETYTTKQNCLKGIDSVRRNADDLGNFQLKIAKDNSPYFVLIANNGEPIGTSEMYSSEQAREVGIEAVRNYSKTTKVIDRTEKPNEDIKYRFKVDQEVHLSEKEHLTGREILTLAGIVPVQNFLLRQILHGNQPKPIGLEEVVDLSKPGIERFVTIPKDPRDG